jgi:hypothetical protein
MKLEGDGITMELPPGWEGRITRRPQEQAPRVRPGAAFARTNPVAHLGNFAIGEADDFGGGVVQRMEAGDAFVVLFEYGPEAAGTALFARQGLPADLVPERFSPRQLQRTLPGQAGYQTFFTENGRPFCLYVVLGSKTRARALVPQVNQVLARTTIHPR